MEQGKTPAKITTDGTVFAASLPVSSDVKKVLEVGAGTGVLSLMLAQRFHEIKIDALEINPVAFEEARTNFNNSKWSRRLKVFLSDFNRFQAENKYDLIFSNPPFFNHNLQSKINHGKNLAYHTNQLSFEALSKGINANLTESGEAHIMLPPYEMSLFEQQMKLAGFYCHKTCELRHQVNSKIIRLFKIFDRGEGRQRQTHEVIILRDENNDFHPSYISLMKDFLTIF